MADGFAFKVEGQAYQIAKLMLSEARAIQRVTGKTLGEWERAVNDGDVDCLAALVWVARKRERPSLTMDEVEFDVLSFEPIVDEDDEEDAGESGKDDPSVTLAGT
jgi:hypothetical protein